MPRLSTPDFAKAHQEAYSLVRLALEAEVAQNYSEALDFHNRATEALRYYVSILKAKSEERKRAKLQLRFTIERSNTLGKYVKAVAVNTGTAVILVPQPLPSEATINHELLNPNSTVFLSMVRVYLVLVPLKLTSSSRAIGRTQDMDEPP